MLRFLYKRKYFKNVNGVFNAELDVLLANKKKLIGFKYLNLIKTAKYLRFLTFNYQQRSIKAF